MNTLIKSLVSCALATALSTALSTTLSSQDLGHKAPAQSSAIILTGVTIHTVSGEILPRASILFREGRIAQIAKNRQTITVDGAVEVIDLEGQHLYPGFVALASTMGLTEIGSVEMSLDIDEAGSVSPEVRAGVAINTDSWVIPVTRRNGVLTCGVMPSGGRIPGRATVIRMDGWTWEDMAIVADAGLVLNWPSVGPFGSDDSKRMETSKRQLAELDELFDSAAAYLEARHNDATVETDLRLRALGGAVLGTTKVFIHANGLAQIESAVAWAVERKLDFIIVGGHEAAQCTDLLARHDVPVAITAAHRMPRRRDVSYREPYELPAKLEAAGIRWCLTYSPSSWTNSSQRNLPYEAAACIAHGLDRAAALRSVTLSPAELLGLGDELGSIEVGKRATMFLTDGDALEPTTRVLSAYIDGRKIDLTDKQTALDAKYREKYRQLGLIE